MSCSLFLLTRHAGESCIVVLPSSVCASCDDALKFSGLTFVFDGKTFNLLTKKLTGADIHYAFIRGCVCLLGGENS